MAERQAMRAGSTHGCRGTGGPTPSAQTLLDVPVYNFDDQSARALPKPVTLKPGDTYRVTCTHDATLRTLLPELRPLKPRKRGVGPRCTSDGMCLGIVASFKSSS